MARGAEGPPGRIRLPAMHTDPLGAVAGSGGRGGGRSAVAAPDRAAVMVVLRWLGVGHRLAQHQG